MEHLTYEERFKEMHLTVKERRERGDFITIYKLIENHTMKRKEEAKYLR